MARSMHQGKAEPRLAVRLLTGTQALRYIFADFHPLLSERQIVKPISHQAHSPNKHLSCPLRLIFLLIPPHLRDFLRLRRSNCLSIKT